ncbi:MAG: large conductance mechanosensitive channel protein MscL [Acholeplasmataceae bacterium]
MKAFINDFKKFIKRGNVLDLAVAVIIGGAFGKIVQSLVNHILMPVLSLIFGQGGFENYKYVIRRADLENNITENAINYGLFIQNIIDFIIIAFVIFVIIHSINRVQDKIEEIRLKEVSEQLIKEETIKAEKAAVEVKKPTTEELLADIKVLLEKSLK